MRKNRVQNVAVHTSEQLDYRSYTERMNQFHVEIIERRLQQSGLSTQQKIQVIDKIISDMKAREDNGIIR